jgi:hypothetical protein
MHPPEMQLIFVLNESKMIICHVLSCRHEIVRTISVNLTSQIILENCIIVKHKDICRVVRLILRK